MRGPNKIASDVVVVHDAVILRIIDAKKRVLANQTLLCRHKLSLLGVKAHVLWFDYLKILNDFVFILTKKI